MNYNTTVYDKTGSSGTFSTGELNQTTVCVQLEHMPHVYVPRELFQQQDDGTYHLPLSFSEMDEQTTHTIPVIEESIQVGKQWVESGKVHVHKMVDEVEHPVEQTLYQDSVDIERVPVNEIVDEPEKVHYDKDRITIPVYEEVLVVAKRLRLKERINITRSRQSKNVNETVKLRQEQVTVEREDMREREDEPEKEVKEG